MQTVDFKWNQDDIDAINHALDIYHKQHGNPFDVLCALDDISRYTTENSICRACPIYKDTKQICGCDGIKNEMPYYLLDLRYDMLNSPDMRTDKEDK
jgi:hypothetical protein